MMQLNAYDPAFLEVLQCGWFPAGEFDPKAAVLQALFMPRKAGSTEVRFNIRPIATQPEYMYVTFSVTLNPGGQS